MNTNTKTALAFLFGVAAGAVPTYYIVRNRIRNEADAEIEDVKAYYSKKQEQIEKDAENRCKPELKEALEEAKDEVEKDIPDEYLQQEETPQKVAYNKISSITPERKAEVQKKNENLDTSGVLTREEAPFEISEDEYFSENDEYEKEQLTYFEEDDTIMDINEEKIDNSLFMVGTTIADCTDLREDGVMYVRSPRYKTDYEITYEEGSYENFLKGM